MIDLPVEGDEPKEKKKDVWDKIQAISPLISGILIAVVGYLLTGAVNNGFQNSQLQLGYAKETQELLAKLRDPEINPTQAKDTAMALAAFGPQAIHSLVNEIESSGFNRSLGAEYGLRAVALADPANTCPELRRIVENRTAAYNWLAHRAAIRILGVANCPSAISILSNYGQRLQEASGSQERFKAFQKGLEDTPALARGDLDKLTTEVNQALTLLDQGKRSW